MTVQGVTKMKTTINIIHPNIYVISISITTIIDDVIYLNQIDFKYYMN